MTFMNCGSDFVPAATGLGGDGRAGVVAVLFDQLAELGDVGVGLTFSSSTMPMLQFSRNASCGSQM